MTSDQARDRFSEAAEDVLDDETRAHFERALSQDPELQSEWEAFRSAFAGARALGRAHEDARAPDLLPKVQSRLRARSRGRFYRDRFAERSGRWTGEVLLALTALVLLGLVSWLLISGGP